MRATADLGTGQRHCGIVHHSELPADGKMPDGAVIIAAITSCTNTSNPRNTVALQACWRVNATRPA
jgi:2-methylcitrate dehydratase (2-methyl-trans-aconitate forming)